MNARKHFFNENYFDYNNLSSASTYWLGFLMADSSSIQGSLRTRLAIKDIDHLKLLNNHIDSTYPIITGESERNGKIHKYAELIITSKSFTEKLKIYNIVPRKTFLNVEFPEILKNHIYLNHYIRGLIDGDGTITNRAKNLIHISLCGSPVFIEYIYNYICNHLNIRGYIKNISKYMSLFVISKDEYVFKFANYLTKGANVYLERKFNKIHNFMENYPKRHLMINDHVLMTKYYETNSVAETAKFFNAKYGKVKYRIDKLKILDNSSLSKVSQSTNSRIDSPTVHIEHAQS